MKESSVTHYRSADFLRQIRKRALVFWSITSGISLVWVILILAAPVAASAGSEVSGTLYGFFSYVCHQLPERSFFIFGNKFAVCSRCFGVYFGLLAGMASYPLLRPMDVSDPLPRFWLFASMLPIAIDWSLGMFGIWENTFLSRVASGLILGVGCAVFIVPALVEIAEVRLSRSLQTKKAA